ncbi:hypothetical protein [Sphingomonas abaci]|uniref:Uncharacterized protein n=1 Tax=Sphingomonas abaci TaxID=237611 RepID=A0A7W7AHI4_9SPHN|nr:hypothetical protein [Sphingomonas abaci]MBB4616946.1 hypothetical protein [Sphingomonas abaci]
MMDSIKHGSVTSMQDEMAYRFARIAPLPFTTNAYRNRVDGRRKAAALIALVLVCAASLYRGGFA